MSLVRSNPNRIAISYVLWAAIFLGFCGLHRIYNGKIVTGILWFFTFGLCGIGQVIDLFLIPSMVERHDLKLQRQLGYGSSDFFPTPPLEPAPNPVPPNLTPEQQMVLLVKAAAKRGGKLTVTQGVLASGLSFVQVETLLMEMVRSGYAHIGNDPITGAVTYYFDEL
nr:TM2 domain-containing protein [Trichothermofontia sichuanensis]